MTRTTRSSAILAAAASIVPQPAHHPEMAAMDMQLRSGAKRKASTRTASTPNTAGSVSANSSAAAATAAAAATLRAAQEQMVVAAYEMALGRSGRSTRAAAAAAAAAAKAKEAQSIPSSNTDLKSMADELDSISASAANAADAKTADDDEPSQAAVDKENAPHVPAPLSSKPKRGGKKSDRLSKLVTSVQTVTMELEAELKELSPCNSNLNNAATVTATTVPAPLVTAATVNTSLFASSAPAPLTLSPRTLLVRSGVAMAAVPNMAPLPAAASSASAHQPQMQSESVPATPESQQQTLSVPATDLAAQIPSPVLAPPMSPTLKIDSATTPGLAKPYVSINPYMLQDSAWSFKDLQGICTNLNLPTKGKKREALVAQLQAWHRFDYRTKSAEELAADAEDDHPLSIRRRMTGTSNFATVQIDTAKMLRAASVPLPSPAAAPRYLAAAAAATPGAAGAFPVSPDNDGHANGNLPTVSVAHSLPQLLTPLLFKSCRKRSAGAEATPTPAKSILASPCPRFTPQGVTVSETQKRLAFSVFNGVKLIPNREDARAVEEKRTPSPTKTLAFGASEEEENHNSSMAEGDEDAAGDDCSFEIEEVDALQQQQDQQEALALEMQAQQEQQMWEEKAREDAAAEAEAEATIAASQAAAERPSSSSGFLTSLLPASVSAVFRKALTPRKSITPSLGFARAADAVASAAIVAPVPVPATARATATTAHFSFTAIPPEHDSMMAEI